MIALGDGCDAILEGYEQALKSGGAPIVLAERERNLEKLGIAAIKPPRDFWGIVHLQEITAKDAYDGPDFGFPI